MEFVLGYSGIPAPVERTRQKIIRFHNRNSFARDLMKDLVHISRRGIEALEKGDMDLAGQQMTKSHKTMVTLGAGHPDLDRIVQAAQRHSYGAKLTGAGGGGCMIALARESQRVIEDIQDAGGIAWKVKPAERGVRLED